MAKHSATNAHHPESPPFHSGRARQGTPEWPPAWSDTPFRPHREAEDSAEVAGVAAPAGGAAPQSWTGAPRRRTGWVAGRHGAHARTGEALFEDGRAARTAQILQTCGRNECRSHICLETETKNNAPRKDQPQEKQISERNTVAQRCQYPFTAYTEISCGSRHNVGNEQDRTYGTQVAQGVVCCGT